MNKFRERRNSNSFEKFKKANQLAFYFICLTSNLEVGVSNRAIEESIIRAKDYYEGIIIAGKMHSAGVNEPVITLEFVVLAT